MAVEVIDLDRLSYDPENEVASFLLTGHRGGKPFTVTGAVHVTAPEGLGDRAVQAATRAELAAFLSELSVGL